MHTQSIYYIYLLYLSIHTIYYLISSINLPSYILYYYTYLSIHTHTIYYHISLHPVISTVIYPSISYLFISPSIACYMLPKYVYIHLYTTLYSYIYTSLYQSYICDMLYPMSSLYAILSAAYRHISTGIQIDMKAIPDIQRDITRLSWSLFLISRICYFLFV